jgi:predicted nucleic acid-binding protein
MTVVIDASLLVALVAMDPRTDAVSTRLAELQASGESLHAPALTPFEVANGLTRLNATGALADDHLEPAWQTIQALPLAYHPLRDGPSVIRLARRLDRHSAYDAAYVALAQELKGVCWTLDGRLVRSATRLGLPVRLAADGEAPRP